MPEELSISTTLAKEKLAPILRAAGLPSLDVRQFACRFYMPVFCICMPANHVMQSRHMTYCIKHLMANSVSTARLIEDITAHMLQM